MPANRQKVEKFKLSEEQVRFTKNFGQYAKIRKLLQGEFIQKAGETKRLGSLLDGLTQKMQQALRLAPQEPTRELEGQEPPREGV